MSARAEVSPALLSQGLPPELKLPLTVLVEQAARRRWNLFLVGGAVRDLLLGRVLLDLDLATEGDAMELARVGAAILGGEVREHPAFLTASLLLPGGWRADLVRTRREHYAAPGALPRVAPASIVEDLARRDFTVNAMALCLGINGTVELLDPHGGRGDLEQGRLGILHPASMRDDPTRSLRGVRFEVRLGFRLSSDTAEAVAEAIGAGYFSAVSGARLAAELELLSREPQGLDQGLARLAELGILAVLHPRLRGDLTTRARLDAAQREMAAIARESASLGSPYRLLLLGLALELRPAERGELAARLEPRQEEVSLLTQGAGRVEELLRGLGAATPPHAAARALERASAEELAWISADDGWPGHWARRFRGELRQVEVRLNGEELKQEGVAPGPLLGEVLREVRNARLDGRIAAGEELRFAREFLARHS